MPAVIAALLALIACARAQALPQAPDETQHADATSELRAAIDLLKTHHMNRDRLDWPAVEARALAALKGQPESPIAAYPIIREIIAELGEKHTGLVPASSWRAVMADDPTIASTALPEAHALGHTIGILTIEGSFGSDAQYRAYVEAARRGLERLEAQGVCRFVIDLRGNGGGNMWPMLNGVAALLGRPPYGHFVLTGGTTTAWSLDTPWMAMAYTGVGASPPDDARPGAPVALLLNDRTASSGEFTAIAFEGRKRTMFFGEPTAGYVTANAVFSLPDGAQLLISGGWSTDRLGRPYRVAVVPDRETARGQPTLDAAVAWLKSQSCHP